MHVELLRMWKWKSKQMDIQEFILVEKFTILEALIINFHGKFILYEHELYTSKEIEWLHVLSYKFWFSCLEIV